MGWLAVHRGSSYKIGRLTQSKGIKGIFVVCTSCLLYNTDTGLIMCCDLYESDGLCDDRDVPSVAVEVMGVIRGFEW